MDSFPCVVQYVSVFTLWCSNCSIHRGLQKGKNEWARKREHTGEREQKERIRNELRWVQHLHSLPAFFWSEEGRRGKKKKGGGCASVCVCVFFLGGGVEETSVRWRSFWRLQWSCTRAGEPSMGLKNTAKTWLNNGIGPHAWFKGPVRNGKRVKDRIEMMDLLGCRVVKTVE